MEPMWGCDTRLIGSAISTLALCIRLYPTRWKLYFAASEPFAPELQTPAEEQLILSTMATNGVWTHSPRVTYFAGAVGTGTCVPQAFTLASHFVVIFSF